jgi:hypothetical protein
MLQTTTVFIARTPHGSLKRQTANILRPQILRVIKKDVTSTKSKLLLLTKKLCCRAV